MPSLKRIRLEGFKSIKEMDLELRSLNVLIGANGAGKTNFISAFALLNQIAEENLQNFVAESGGANRLLYFGQKVTDEILIDLGFERNGYETNGYKARLKPAAGDRLFFAEETCWGIGAGFPKPYEVPLGQGHKESRLQEEIRADRGKIASYLLRGLKSWRVYHFHDTSRKAGIKQTAKIDDNSSLRADASNLAPFLYLLQEKHPKEYDLIVDTIRLAAPFFDTFVLRPNPLNPDTIKLEWRERASNEYFDADSLSDGTLRFICLATLLLQPALASAILIDEPELGLHPYAITLLADMIRNAAAKAQVILSTQSVSLVNHFQPEDVIVVDRDLKQSTFRRLEKQELQSWLEDYGLGELWEKNVIGGRP